MSRRTRRRRALSSNRSKPPSRTPMNKERAGMDARSRWRPMRGPGKSLLPAPTLRRRPVASALRLEACAAKAGVGRKSRAATLRPAAQSLQSERSTTRGERRPHAHMAVHMRPLRGLAARALKRSRVVHLSAPACVLHASARQPTVTAHRAFYAFERSPQRTRTAQGAPPAHKTVTARCQAEAAWTPPELVVDNARGGGRLQAAGGAPRRPRSGRYV